MTLFCVFGRYPEDQNAVVMNGHELNKIVRRHSTPIKSRLCPDFDDCKPSLSYRIQENRDAVGTYSVYFAKQE